MSRHNVEVYRCVACHADVVTVGVGFELSEDEINEWEHKHSQECPILTQQAAQDA